MPGALGFTLRLASSADAPAIAALSRDRIEHGLGWRWTAARVLRSVREPATNAVVAKHDGTLLGFGLMTYFDDEAHLLLLAVQAQAARRGVGSAVLAWLERSAQVAGIAQISLEARLANEPARAFYAQAGYREVEVLAGYYLGRESAVRLAKVLRPMRVAPD